MSRYSVNQHLIFPNLYSVSISKIVVIEFSQNLNLIDIRHVNTVIQSNQQHGRYVFSKVIECLEQDIRKQIDCERPSSTKRMNRVQNIRIKISK